MQTDPAVVPLHASAPDRADASQSVSDLVESKHLGGESSCSGPLDENVLVQLRDLQQEGEPDVIEEVANAYLDSSASLMTEIIGAAEEDPRALREAAHRLKSCSANMGATRLQALCEVLEEQAQRRGPYDDRLLARVQAEYRAVREAVVELARKKVS